MKHVATLLAAALVCAGAGAAFLTAARLQRHMADAQEQIATRQYAEAAESLAVAERRLSYAQWLPWVGAGPLKEVRARQAALRYWQGDYEAVLPAQAQPVALVDEANVELQFVVANAAFRAGVRGAAADRAALVQALSEAANGYQTVLRNDTWHEDAAHNYEFVVRLRDEVAKGRRPPPPPDDGADLGQSGAPSAATTMQGFEIYIPLEGNERTPEGGEAGKAEANQRKG